MLTLEGAALMAEVVATALLIVGLVGFRIRRTTPWLACAALAGIMLLSTVMVLIDKSTT
jgi:hypothetical protein